MDYLIAIADQFAPQLRSLRKARGLSQVDMALKLRVSQSRIAAIERNPSAVSAGQLLQYLTALGATLVLRDSGATVGHAADAPSAHNSGPQGKW